MAVLGRSSGSPAGAVRVRGRRTAVPVYTYAVEPGVPSVSVLRIDEQAVSRVAPSDHTHDFPGLVYFPSAGGSLRRGEDEWQVTAGDLLIVVPGDLIGIGTVGGLDRAGGRAVFFRPDALTGTDRLPVLAWRHHPLLALFAPTMSPQPLRHSVPPDDRGQWSDRITAVETELLHRRPGYRDAVLAHLTLLVVAATRLAAADRTSGGTREGDVVAAVLEVVEARYRDRLSVPDVARAVGLTPGHVTTVVRRRTGQTVLDLITERRMAEARRLLVETDSAVAGIARIVGYADAAYFARAFKRTSGCTASQWRARARRA